jgi:ATP-dependent DNA helicase RecG
LVEPGATLADIDEEAIATYKSLVARAGRLPDVSTMTTQALLTKLRLVVDGGLTRAALVLFGKDPARYYPNAFVKIGRFAGPSGAMSFQETCEGNLFQLVQRVLAQLETKFLIKPVRFEGLQRIEELEYPVAALREMLLNALVHRDYAGSMVQLRVMDDRISVWNPGELPHGLTVEMLHQEHESIPRNALIADVCYKAGYIDSWGQGVKRMTESCAASGLGLPHIEERSGGVYVELRKVHQEDDAASGKRREDVGKASGKRRESVGKTAERVLSFCETNPMVTIPEMAKEIGVSDRSIERHISNLQDWNLLRRVGGRKEGRWEVIQNESHP